MKTMTAHSENLTPYDVVNYINAKAENLRSIELIQVNGWVEYKDGDKEVLVIYNVIDGKYYATTSKLFREGFDTIRALFDRDGVGRVIKVVHNLSMSGRTYLTAEIVKD